MITTTPARSGPGRRAAKLLAAATALALLSGCASFYVDTATREVASSEYRKPEQPRPVQMLFEFQTKGVANARASELLKAQVGEQVKASGLFSAVEDGPVEGGAILSISLDNVPLSDDAFAKGFVTGLTFGLAGNQVTDGYICTVNYTTAQAPEPIVKKVRHAIHTVVGAKGGPEGAVKSENAEAAVRTMTRQAIGTALRDLSHDPAFR